MYKDARTYLESFIFNNVLNDYNIDNFIYSDYDEFVYIETFYYEHEEIEVYKFIHNNNTFYFQITENYYNGEYKFSFCIPETTIVYVPIE